MRQFAFFALLTAALSVWAQDPLLTGTPMGSSPSVDYSQSNYPATTTTNTCTDAFDGDMNTFFASYERSNTWCGLDLGQPYIITRAGWAARNDGNGPRRMKLGLIEGSNSPDFLDAIPLYLITANGVIGQMTYTNITCTRGVRYVRYVGPNNSRCNIAELALYGHPGVGDDSELYTPTNLPCVTIHTTSGQDPVDKINELRCMVSVIGDGAIVTDSATTRLRGNMSANFEKKPYRIKFDRKHNVLDAPAKAKKWTLINNYGDKTLMRNLLAFECSRLLDMPYTPYGRAVDVIMNGEYKGCYQLCDQVEVGQGRVDKNTQYFWEIDAYANEEPYLSWFYSNHYNPVTIKDPKDDEITEAQHDSIVDYFNLVEDGVYNNDTYKDTVNGWRRLLDAETFLKHFLVGEFSGNTDTYWSTYQYKLKGEDKVYTGPVWDFDLGFNNDNRTYPIQDKTNWIFTIGSAAGDMKNWVRRVVIYDTHTKDELLQLWAAARCNGLTPEHMLALADSLAEEMNASQALNFTRWPMLTQWVHQNPQVAGSYQGEVNVVKTYMQDRIAWIDQKLGFDTTTLGVPGAACIEQSEKVMINGRMYIKRDNKLYDILGNTWKEE